MFNFENQICDVCGKPFDKNSDIVVCPDCGTPHHRECWHQLGHCVNRDKHSQGYEWQPVKKERVPGSITCHSCGSVMPAGTLFCENCGKALNEPASNPFNRTMPNNGRVEGNPFGGIPGQEEFRRFVDREYSGEIEGISVKDIAAYIGPNAQYYTYKFKRMESNPKYKPFNWTACFFAPLWFLFRKMWPVAIVAALLNFITSIPTFIIYSVQLGLVPATSPLMFPGIENAANILSFISMIISIVFGFIAIPMYKKDTVKRIRKLKAETDGNINMYYQRLLEQSGPSKIGMVAVVLFAAYFMFSLLMPY